MTSLGALWKGGGKNNLFFFSNAGSSFNLNPCRMFNATALSGFFVTVLEMPEIWKSYLEIPTF